MVSIVDLLLETAAIGWESRQFPALGIVPSNFSAPVHRSHRISSRSRGGT